MDITIPSLSLVVLIGASGSGKSTFARKHFRPTEILSSDACRALVSDDENDQSATPDAFDVLFYIARKRLAAGRLTVVDATNVQPESRKKLIALAREHDVLPAAIVFNVAERVAQERNRLRSDRQTPPHAIKQQSDALRRSLRSLAREGFRSVNVLSTAEEIDSCEIVRQKLWNDRRDDHGPFDIIGDVHGCRVELVGLLEALGYVESDGVFAHPAGRRVLFLGDLVDRGPDSPGVLRIAMSMSAAGSALCVPGNHDAKLMRKLRGRNVKLTHGLAETMEQMENEPPAFHRDVAEFIDSLVSHYVLDDGKLVVAHAGMKEAYQGRASGRVREFAMYGETTGETDEFGLPIRYNWAAEYRGRAMVVYGHTPIPSPEWLNNTINIDSGCVFGGRLTALRYPERELVSIAAERVYADPIRPLVPVVADGLSAQQEHDTMLDIDDLLGKRIITTRVGGTVTIREENSAAALEMISRFAVDPKWLIYVPPTMSPSETSTREGYLEHPAEAFEYYRKSGVEQVVCEEKHMGSRVVVVVCRDEKSARERFGVTRGEIGICYTRTGRRFFAEEVLERALLDTLRGAIEAAEIWKNLDTDWLCLDCELMPWSAKAQELLRLQYAAVGSAARASLSEAATLLGSIESASTKEQMQRVTERTIDRRALVEDYVAAYRRYCWPVRSLDDLRIAPFHLLASEGAVHADKDHLWHMSVLGRLAAMETAPRIVQKTRHMMVTLDDEASVAEGIAWWEEMTGGGGEGMVVKPLHFMPAGRVQPAVKCRGREYLRIIYGPEYTLPENMERLRSRGVGRKRSLAMREFALGIEGLERFVRSEPLRRVHECAFGVLALESEPVDPRL